MVRNSFVNLRELLAVSHWLNQPNNTLSPNDIRMALAITNFGTQKRVGTPVSQPQVAILTTNHREETNL